MSSVSKVTAKRKAAKRKKARALNAKLHAINTGAIKSGRPRFDKQKNTGTLQQFERGFRGIATTMLAGYGGYKLGANIGKVAATSLKFSPGALIVGKLISDASKPNQAQIVHNKRQNALGADKKRKIRAKTGEGNIFQRALDFDIGEYFSGDYSDKPKKTGGGKVRSVSGELASSSKGPKPKAKRTTRKKTSTIKDKRAGAKIKVVRGGKTFYRKNPHYGK